MRHPASHDRDRDHGAGERTTPRDGSAGTEPEIVRHSTLSPTPCSVDEAVEEMDDEGLDFHLFVEAASGPAAVTVSSQPAPLLATTEAVSRLGLTGLPFLF